MAREGLRIDLKRWKRLLLWSLPVWLLVLVVGVKLCAMVAFNERGRDAYRAGDYPGAGADFGKNRAGNVVEPWVAHFNAGTTAAQQRRWDDAATEFVSALRTVPAGRACMVRLNLAATLEGAGDELAAGQQHAAAQAKYEEALRVLREGACGGEPTPSKTPPPSESPSTSATPSTATSSASPSPTASGSPTSGTSGSPTSGTSGSPTSGTSGSPTSGTSGSATSGPSGSASSEADQKSDEQRRDREARERLEKKAEEERRKAEDSQDDSSPSAEPTGSAEPDSPEEQQQREQRMRDKERKAREEEQSNRDYEDRPKEADVDRPW